MKILHILNDGAKGDVEEIISNQSRENEVEVIDLKKMDISYEEIVDKIEQCDKVISW